MPAKRTVREIKRQNQVLTMILDTSKRLGPGQNRIAQFNAAMKKVKEYTSLPSWRRAYVTGYAEGASAILALVDAGAIVPGGVRVTEPAPAPVHVQVKPAARAMKVLTAPVVPEIPPPAPVPALPANGHAPDAVTLLRQLLDAMAAQQAR